MVVVGAGLAGLVCAAELERAGRRVTVLEARDRPGGRVYTVRKNFAAGQHAEGGGEFIEPGHGFMRLYAKRFGLGLEDLRTEPDWRLRTVVYLGRRHIPSAALTGAPLDAIEKFWSRVRMLAAPLDPLDPTTRGAALDRRSAAWLLDSLRIGGIARTIVDHELRERFTVEPEKLSLLFLCQSVKRTGGPGLGEAAFRIRGGNDQLPSALAHRLDDLRLSAPARRIELGAGGVRVVAKGGDVHARLCVLTAPFPAVTNLLEFSPPLHPLLREAIRRLRYGVTTKLALQYSRRFWRARDESGRIVTDLTFQSTWEATSGQGGSSGILVANSAGRPGALYAGRYSSTRPLLAADEIDDVYPGSRRLYTQGNAAVWLNELPSGGAIAAYAPGQVTRYWDVIRKRHGRLLLAGEHTDSYCGTMEGAVRSGRRAAAEANALL